MKIPESHSFRLKMSQIPYEEYAKKIKLVFKEYRPKFEKNKPKKEKEVGFDEDSRLGSHTFCHIDGNFMEKIYQCGGGIKHNKNSIDGFCGGWCYDAKARHDTTNAEALKTKARLWLKFSNDNNMKFVILVSTDIREQSRDIPLHQGHNLSFVKDLPGYDPKRHRWISGSKVLEFVFPGSGKRIEKLLREYRKSLKLSGVYDSKTSVAFRTILDSEERLAKFEEFFADNPAMLSLLASEKEKFER